ncbi:MAG TPA: SIS domain-containing protein, partial [Candidatus Bathyarchaeia archaeon]|nr:SIS domain-containing protein [Candidatus Bathyarchaeia archaeon]
RRLRGRIDQRVPFAENQAKRFATLLKDRLPVIFASSRMAAVARRFKNQLAENSKIQAKYSVLPEAAHNEIEAWHDQRFPLTPVFVRARSESELERSMLESFRSAITKASGTTPQQVRLKANTRLSEILLPVLFLDYVSVYLAILRRVDPIDTPWIRFYKEGR